MDGGDGLSSLRHIHDRGTRRALRAGYRHFHVRAALDRIVSLRCRRFGILGCHLAGGSDQGTHRLAGALTAICIATTGKNRIQEEP